MRVQLVPSGCLALAGWGWRKLLNNRLTVKEMRVQNQKIAIQHESISKKRGFNQPKIEIMFGHLGVSMMNFRSA